MVGGGAQLGHLALGGGGQLVGLAAGGGAHLLGLPLGRPAHVVALALGVGAQFGGVVLGGRALLGGVHLGGGLDLVGLRPGGLDELGGLLLGQPQQLLDAGAETGVGGTFLLLQLPMGVRQLPLQGLGLLAGLPHLVVERLDVLVDLVPVVAAKHHVELARGRVFKEVAELGVDVGLHVAQS